MAKIHDSLKLTPDEIDSLMSSETRIRIATLGPDAEINLTPMTFGWAAGNVYIFARGQKIANLRRNGSATILLDVGSAWRELRGINDEHLFPARLNLGEKHNLMNNGAIQPYAASALNNKNLP